MEETFQLITAIKARLMRINVADRNWRSGVDGCNSRKNNFSSNCLVNDIRQATKKIRKSEQVNLPMIHHGSNRKQSKALHISDFMGVSLEDSHKVG